MMGSVTRFGEISPLWQKLTSLWQIFDSLFLSWLWLICDIIGPIFIIAKGQILKNNLTNWSNWAPMFDTSFVSSFSTKNKAFYDRVWLVKFKERLLGSSLLKLTYEDLE